MPLGDVPSLTGAVTGVERAAAQRVERLNARVHFAMAEMFAVVIDTSVITSDVIKTVKGGLPSPLYLAMQTGLVRGYMAHHTWAEVPRVLAKRAPKENCDLAAVEKLWWDQYVKLIRFVPTADLPPGDPDLERALRARDASDLPTVKLASLIAPAVVLAADPDLVDIGLAYERWWDVPEVIRKMVAGQGSTELAARAVFGSAYGTVALLRGAVRALQRPWVAAGILAIAAIALLTRETWYPHLRQRIEQAGPGVRDAAASAGRWIFGLFEEYGHALTVWSSAQRGRPGQTLVHTVARVLATSPEPMTRTEIANRLHAQVASRGHQAVMANLQVILNQHQAFCQVTRHRWQLGKEDARVGSYVIPPQAPLPKQKRHAER
jgi:predicted nucleic acid-binding protein